MESFYDEKVPVLFSSILYESVRKLNKDLEDCKTNDSEKFLRLANALENVKEPEFLPYELSQSEIEKLRGRTVNVEKESYLLLSEQALHSYFSWRTAIREIMSYETIVPNSPDFNFVDGNTLDWYVFIYMFELINLIGIDNPIQGFKNLKKLNVIFNNMDRVHRYEEIVFDFGVYYGLETPQSVKMHSVVERLYNNEYVNPNNYDFYKKHSAYNYLTSSFYSHEKGYLIEEIMPYVFEAIYKHMKRNGVEISHLVAGKFCTRVWKPFEGCPFVHRNRQNPICGFNPHYIRSYAYEDGDWVEYYWQNSNFTEAIIGFIYKITEKFLREYFHYNYRITVNIDQLLLKVRNNSDFHTDDLEPFRTQVYGHECSRLIKRTVHNYIRMKEC